MNKSEAVVGNKYVVIGNSVGCFAHDFEQGDVVTLLANDGTNRLRFERKGDSTKCWVDLENVEPFVAQAVPVNKFGFKVGDKFKVIHEEDFRVGDVVTLIIDDGSLCPYFRNQDGKEMFEYYKYLQLIVEGSPVEIAKANLAKAQAELDAAVKAEEDSKKFQESDIKSFMFVALKYEKHSPLRLVVTVKDNVSFFNAEGVRTNWCTRNELLKDLNETYEKTTKTIKDFANA